jgi:predicted enzyme related to lactoylglutathione lyase
MALYDATADGDVAATRAGSEPIYVAVDDLDDTRRRALEAGAGLSTEIIPGVGRLGSIAVRPWGERSFYATDPFGNHLCLVARETAFRG